MALAEELDALVSEFGVFLAGMKGSNGANAPHSRKCVEVEFGSAFAT